MWQPTPSWTQPDPNQVPESDPEPADEADRKPDALSQEFPGDSWSQPASQPVPWSQSQPQTPPPAQPAPSWAQPAAESGSSWTQPASEPDEYDDADKASADTDSGDEGTTTPAAGASGAEGGAKGPAPVFGGSSFTGSGYSGGLAAGGPAGGPAAGSPAAGGPAAGGPAVGGPGHGGHQLSPAAQHFFPQGIPGQHAPQQEREISYRTDELIQALPLPREAPAERGIRSALRLRPGSTERMERIARATAATAFRRPVTVVVANPKGGSGKTPTTLLLAGALGQARGGGVVAWDNNELRGNMHLRTHDTNSRSTVTDMLQAMPMLTQPDARLGDVAAYLRHQVAGQYDVLTSATTTYAQIEAKDFDQIHRLLSRFYKVLVIDTGNNEGSSNWREAMKAADALVIPIKWKSLSCAAAVQMLEELDNQGPEAQRLIRRAVIAVSNGPGDVNKEVEKQLRPYFESRAAAVVDIPTDQHIAAEGALDHSALQPATRRAGLELAAKVSEQITIALNVPR
jgi:MinD-like ATPase involved in chromosome partitioning or flagellar assembly